MTAFPKPAPYTRKRAEVDTRGLRFPKKHFSRERGYRAFVVKFPCALRGEGYGDCPTRAVECAHLETGGLQIKGHDSACAPLCGTFAGHHKRFDRYELPREARQIIRRKAAAIRREWEERQAAKARLGEGKP